LDPETPNGLTGTQPPFVKFALERWRAVSLELFDVLGLASQKVESGPLRRGQQIAADVGAQLDEYLAHPIFREVSSLRRMPMSDQVLLKRAGYREVFRTFAMTESGPTVRIDRGDMTDVFAARNFSRWMSPVGVRRLSWRSPGWCSGLVG
jgi:Domain of unknown function (DUF2357)